MSETDRWDDFESREERADRIQELLGLRAYVAKLEAELDQLKRERDALLEACKSALDTFLHLTDGHTFKARCSQLAAAIALTSASAPSSARDKPPG